MTSIEDVKNKAIALMKEGIKNDGNINGQDKITYNQTLSQLEQVKIDYKQLVEYSTNHVNEYFKLRTGEEQTEIAEYYLQLEQYISILPTKYNDCLKEFERYALKLIAILNDTMANEEIELQKVKIKELKRMIKSKSEYDEEKFNAKVLTKMQNAKHERTTFKDILLNEDVKKSLISLTDYILSSYAQLKSIYFIMQYFTDKYKLDDSLEKRILRVTEHTTYKLLMNNIEELKNYIYSVDKQTLFDSTLYGLMVYSITITNFTLNQKSLEMINDIIEKDEKEYKLNKNIAKYKVHEKAPVSYDELLWVFNLLDRLGGA